MNGKILASPLIALLALSGPTWGSEFMRADTCTGEQLRASQAVLVGSVASLRSSSGGVLAELHVEQALKGQPASVETLSLRQGDSLSVQVRLGQRALFFLAPTEGGGWRPLRGPASVLWLDRPAGRWTRALLKAHLSQSKATLRKALVAALHAPDPQVASGAAQELLGLGRDPGYRGAELKSLLRALDERFGAHADPGLLLRLVGRLRDPQHRPALIRTLATPGRAAWLPELARALEQTDAAGAARDLGATLKRSGSALVRARAARVLGRLGTHEGVLDALSHGALSDADPRVRGYAALALGTLRGEAARRPLSTLLAPREPLTLRKAAALALSEQGRASLEALSELSSGDPLASFVRALRSSPARARSHVLSSLAR